MGIPVLIIGKSGSGKSASLRNFKPDEIGIFNVASKPLPFRAQLKKVDGASYQTIMKGLKSPKLKAYVVDDAQYLMAFESFANVDVTGYSKFTHMAKNYYDLLQCAIKDTPADCVVYFLQHSEETDTGGVKAKTLGKMLDNQLTVEGLFSIVLICKTDGRKHYFETQSDGLTTAKSPMEMFDSMEIDNDLYMVDKTIREYWGFDPLRKDDK